MVVYTNFARKEFEGAFARLRQKRGKGEFPVVDVIPHGIDAALLPSVAGIAARIIRLCRPYRGKENGVW